MGRLARVVVAGVPHHVTQRGNRRLQTFFDEGDYRAYMGLMGRWCRRCGVEVWAFCLMPNHVRLILVPSSAQGLCRAVGEAHRRYTRGINFRKGWRGHLWQGRFASYVMDNAYLRVAARYVEQNPVRARLVERAEDWPWSSARAHIAGADDALVQVEPLLKRFGQGAGWREFLATGVTEYEAEILRRHERTGRVLGDKSFVDRIEEAIGRILHPQKPGPKPKRKGK